MRTDIKPSESIPAPVDATSEKLVLSEDICVEFVNIYDESDADLALAMNCSNG